MKKRLRGKASTIVNIEAWPLGLMVLMSGFRCRRYVAVLAHTIGDEGLQRVVGAI